MRLIDGDALIAWIKESQHMTSKMRNIICKVETMPSANRPQGEVDAIDRDALIDYCLKLIDVERKQGSDVMNYGQERVNQTEAIIDYIEHMPHVNADRPQEWIPCSERLPKIGQKVLASTKKTVFTQVFKGYHSDPKRWAWENNRVKEIEAWQPLPKPWKGADDERP